MKRPSKANSTKILKQSSKLCVCLTNFISSFRESARQNNNIAKLSLERKTEIDVILSEQSRISKATDATTFKADLATIIKNGVTAQEEEEETRPQTGVVNLEIIPSIEENQ